MNTRHLLVLLTTLITLFTANAQELKNPFPTNSPLHRPTARLLETTVKTPALRELLQRSNNDTQVYQFSVMLLANRGLPRLDNTTLSHHLTAMSRLTDQLDTETCAAIFTGKPLSDPNALYDRFLKALSQLDQPTIDTWFEITAKAAVAELKKTQPPQADISHLTNAMQQLLTTLPNEQKTRLESAFERINDINADEACWANRTFLHAALRLPERERQVIARLIAEP